jgi:hypothetical protein
MTGELINCNDDNKARDEEGSFGTRSAAKQIASEKIEEASRRGPQKLRRRPLLAKKQQLQTISILLELASARHSL